MLTPNQIEHFRQLLLHEKEQLEKTIQARETEDRASERESIGELSLYDNHPGDIATELYEREKDFGLIEFSHKQLADVIHALERIDTGKYGICEVSGENIPFERLEAMPTATTCIEHASNKLREDIRPVEEEILAPPFGKYDKDFLVAYDAEDSWQDVASYGTSETPSDMEHRNSKDFSTMFTESDESRGVVENFENFIGTDIYGKNPKVYLGDDHEAYEDMLDDEDMDISIHIQDEDHS